LKKIKATICIGNNVETITVEINYPDADSAVEIVWKMNLHSGNVER